MYHIRDTIHNEADSLCHNISLVVYGTWGTPDVCLILLVWWYVPYTTRLPQSLPQRPLTLYMWDMISYTVHVRHDLLYCTCETCDLWGVPYTTRLVLWRNEVASLCMLHKPDVCLILIVWHVPYTMYNIRDHVYHTQVVLCYMSETVSTTRHLTGLSARNLWEPQCRCRHSVWEWCSHTPENVIHSHTSAHEWADVWECMTFSGVWECHSHTLPRHSRMRMPFSYEWMIFSYIFTRQLILTSHTHSH